MSAWRSPGEVLEMWARRLVTLPLYTLLCVIVVGTLPLLLALAALVDLVRGGPWVVMRCIAFFAFYLTCEVLGTIASFGLWLAGIWPRDDRTRARFLAWNFRLQCWWARTLLRGAEIIFAMRTEVEGGDVVGNGPILLFSRHVSMGDTLLPAVFVSNRYRLRLRYVLKRELLWDPCLDIVGNRLPNCFVRRGSGESEREIALVRQLMKGLSAYDGVLIYPEGTRFSARKRARIVERLARTDDVRLFERAKALTNVLPPRLGGPLALLEANEAADAVFCAHVGFEGAATFQKLLKGSLVGQVIHVGFWRIPFGEIPNGRAAQAEWLYDQWARVDAWVGERLAATGAASRYASVPS